MSATAVGADVTVVARAMGLDGRISDKFLHAGPGYGGSCFPKDTLALTHIADNVGYRVPHARGRPRSESTPAMSGWWRRSAKSVK